VGTTDVEAVSVAPAQFDGDASSAVGRARTPEPRVVRLESWTPGSCMARVEMRAPHGAQPKSWASHGGGGGAEVGKACDNGIAQGLVVRPSRLTVGLLDSVWGAV
jgi:hypothetical protein